jgi:hypothetical protein
MVLATQELTRGLPHLTVTRKGRYLLTEVSGQTIGWSLARVIALRARGDSGWRNELRNEALEQMALLHGLTEQPRRRSA